ncbi:MAG: alpha/beta hydrolase [Pseudomonadota bacterium]
MMRSRVALLLLMVAAACAGRNTTALLSPTPNLYTFETGEAYPEAGVPAQFRTTTTEILYMTDRNPVVDEFGAVVSYGERRDDAMAFGASWVEYGGLGSWDELIARTQASGQAALTRLEPVGLTELARLPRTPLPYQRNGGRLQATSDANAAYATRSATIRREVSARMQATGVDRVLLYIHGFNNEFDDGVGTLASIWHFAGRRSLPMLFSWPAGNDGPLAYFRDIESGEFSVFHLKEFMRILADVPEVKRIDVVAHSRGSAVMTDALRELMLESRGGGRDPRRDMKTGVLVLAAADLDVGVTRQRLVAERFADGFEQINIYTNPQDGALRLSRLIGNVTRLGGVDPEKLSERELNDLKGTGNVNIIMVESGSVQLGHAYFRENPAVLSDIVLALRTRAMPGTRFRPLEPVAGNIWSLHQNYPAEVLPEMLDLPLVDR